MTEITLASEYNYRRHLSNGAMVKAFEAIEAARRAIGGRYAKPHYCKSGKPQAMRGGSPWPIFEGSRSFCTWFEKPESGLRLVGNVWDISRREGWYGRDWNQGWYVDSNCSEVTQGLVFQLSGKDKKPRFLAGGRDPNNAGAAYLSLEVFDDLISACRRAEQLAEAYAQDAKDHDDAWCSGSNAAELANECKTIRQETLELCAELRELRKETAPGAWPKACSVLRETILEAFDDVMSKREKIAQLKDDCGKQYHDSFNDGYESNLAF